MAPPAPRAPAAPAQAPPSGARRGTSGGGPGRGRGSRPSLSSPVAPQWWGTRPGSGGSGGDGPSSLPMQPGQPAVSGRGFTASGEGHCAPCLGDPFLGLPVLTAKPRVLSYSPRSIGGAVLVQLGMLLATFASRERFRCLACCAPGPFRQSCSPASHSPACVVTQGRSFPTTDLRLPLFNMERFVLLSPSSLSRSLCT